MATRKTKDSQFTVLWFIAHLFIHVDYQDHSYWSQNHEKWIKLYNYLQPDNEIVVQHMPQYWRRGNVELTQILFSIHCNVLLIYGPRGSSSHTFMKENRTASRAKIHGNGSSKLTKPILANSTSPDFRREEFKIHQLVSQDTSDSQCCLYWQ